MKGRFEDVRGLAAEAVVLLEPAPELPMPLPKADPLGAPCPVCLFISEDDCDPLSLGLFHDGVREGVRAAARNERLLRFRKRVPGTFRNLGIG